MLNLWAGREGCCKLGLSKNRNNNNNNYIIIILIIIILLLVGVSQECEGDTLIRAVPGPVDVYSLHGSPWTTGSHATYTQLRERMEKAQTLKSDGKPWFTPRAPHAPVRGVSESHQQAKTASHKNVAFPRSSLLISKQLRHVCGNGIN